MILVSLPLLPWRYDLFPSFLTILAFYYLFKQPIISGILLGCGILAKLYPVILLPVFIIYFFQRKNFRAC
ncbi:hypothetical protein CY0110_10907 [Crocosphaera chwakensis CCY0110]|uniref:DUF2029 domain-containing protein n=1 Tax=Crocosphaera chwakensis CCY0110 TaxID=391612 RepID=A3IZG9_9CHRO|nr:hypothetical protein CY0110_10907 [Crocosphaera chwakensis CCY0110]